VRRTYDAVVVGAGIGGLLAAARIAKGGDSVLVLERLRYVGGRFTTVQQDDFAITTGALHMAPHGGRGPLARAVRELGMPFSTVRRDVIASFLLHDRHIMWRLPWDVLQLVGPRGKRDMLRIGMLLIVDRSERKDMLFSEWLNLQTDDRTIKLLFESFINFALSIHSDQVGFGEVQAFFRSLLRYGLPAIPVGGCGSLVQQLADFVIARRGEIRTHVDVDALLMTGGRMSGVRFYDRRAHARRLVDCSVVVSNVGPEATQVLLREHGARLLDTNASLPKAAGLKLHIVGDRSLIPHNGILLCLDTRRICGMVEVSRAVPSVAPGRHMVDTFQVLGSDNLVEERALAEADLRELFGPAFQRHYRVVRTSAFSARWPVNHAVQGKDLHDQEPIPGLLMVGDAYKPSGHIMVEGVAASVRRIGGRLALL
jgi:phytoene dehydrogenase-like protein